MAETTRSWCREQILGYGRKQVRGTGLVWGESSGPRTGQCLRTKGVRQGTRGLDRGGRVYVSRQSPEPESSQKPGHAQMPTKSRSPFARASLTIDAEGDAPVIGLSQAPECSAQTAKAPGATPQHPYSCSQSESLDQFAQARTCSS